MSLLLGRGGLLHRVGPVILLGTPADNPIIKFLAEQHFLAYETDALKFPGAGRGLVTWQRDGVGRGQESIALIAKSKKQEQAALTPLAVQLAAYEALSKLGGSGTTLFLDTSPRPSEQARRMAEAMGARYVALPRTDAQGIHATVAASLTRPTA